MTDEEEKIINIVGSVAVEGDNLVQESSCTFFDHDYVNEIVISQNLTGAPDIAAPSTPSRDTKESALKQVKFTDDLEIAGSSTENMDTKENIPTERKCPYKSGNKKKFVRVQRLNSALEASDKLINLTETRNSEKTKYLHTKLKLYEREVVAKEKTANILENLYLYFIGRASGSAKET